MRSLGRLLELDAMRGIAAIMVVLVHAAQILADQDPLISRVVQWAPLRPLLDGRQPVIFFFVLSGLALTRALLADPSPGYFSYASRRAIRLCVPASVAVLLSAGLYHVLYVGGPWLLQDPWLALSWTHEPSPAAILRHALLFGAEGDFYLDGVLWSLVHELRLSLLLPLIAAAAAPAYRLGGMARYQGGATLLTMVGGMLIGLTLGGDWIRTGSLATTLVFLIWRALPVATFIWFAAMVSLPSALATPGGKPAWTRWVPFAGCMLGGVLLSLNIDGADQIMLGTSIPMSFLATLYFAPCFLLGAALSLGALDRFAPGPEERGLCVVAALVLMCFENLFATTVASMLIILAAQQPGRLRASLRTRIPLALGRMSFSLYLVHIPLLLAISHGLHKFLSMGAITALWLALTIPAAWGFFRLIEHPSQCLARYLGRRSKPATLSMARPPEQFAP